MGGSAAGAVVIAGAVAIAGAAAGAAAAAVAVSAADEDEQKDYYNPEAAAIVISAEHFIYPFSAQRF